MNVKYYPMFSSPQIWIRIPVSLTLPMLNMMNGLNNLVSGMVLQNILYKLWHLSPLMIPLLISSYVLTFVLLKNQRYPIFALDIFVGVCTPSLNPYQPGINKVSYFSVLIITEYRIVYGKIVLYDYTIFGLGIYSISLNVRRTWKLSIQNENNVVLNENSVEVKPCINRESKSNELTI